MIRSPASVSSALPPTRTRWICVLCSRASATSGEPIFVPRPDGEAEDDGVLMACTHGPDGKASFVVLDASTMEELASCEADVTLGYGFHGTMLSDV